MCDKLTLGNGVRIVSEHMDGVRSASIGIWVGSGSRYETAAENGASHFIEHMVFKGTRTRTASELAEEMDAVGGQTNAFTAKECTSFYGRVLDVHLDKLTDVLCDMFFESKFDEEDVINERGVIYEEIDMYRDSPEDLVSERLIGGCLKGSGLARPILGTKKTLAPMTGEWLKSYMKERYTGENVVVALSGSFTERDIDALAARFSEVPAGSRRRGQTAKYTPCLLSRKKAIEQNHICIGFPGVSLSDSSRYAVGILSMILGGGMSSRLFQTVREKNGLCYNVYTSTSSYLDTGLFVIYTATGRDTEKRAVELIRQEIERFKDGGPTEQELYRAREQIKANVILDLESSSARMNRLGRNELFFGGSISPDELIAKYDTVTGDQVTEAARRLLDMEYASVSAVGRVMPADEYPGLLRK